VAEVPPSGGDGKPSKNHPQNDALNIHSRPSGEHPEEAVDEDTTSNIETWLKKKKKKNGEEPRPRVRVRPRNAGIEAARLAAESGKV